MESWVGPGNKVRSYRHEEKQSGEPSQKCASTTFLTVEPSNIQNFLWQTAQKGTYQIEIDKFYCCKGSATYNY